MSSLLKKGFNIWLTLTTLSLFLLFMVYVFSDDSVDVVEEISVGEVNFYQLAKYLPQNAKSDDTLYKSLKKNKENSNVNVSVIPVSKYSKDKFGSFASMIGAKDTDDIEKYFDLVRISFTNKETAVFLDFLVLEGQMLGFLDSKSKDYVRPWAIALGLFDVSERKIEK